MARRVFTSSTGFIYTVAMEDTPVAGARLWAVAFTSLVDDIDSQPVRVPTTIELDWPKLSARVLPDGIAVLIGVPLRAMPFLRTHRYDIPFTVRAEGYLPYAAVADFLPQGAFPGTFAPRDLLELRLRR